MAKNFFHFVFAYSFFAREIEAGKEHNVFGYAWSENIGWISFNSTSGGGKVNYGVNIKNNGVFEGYAWSENIGWISFNEGELSGCPSTPCRAWVDLKTGQVFGWARVCAVFSNPNLCRGSLNPNRGDWDGWIKLRGTAQNGSPYGLSINSNNGQFQGFAWSDKVLGWVSFNCQNKGVCGISDYKVITIFNQPPKAAFSCDASQCPAGSCNSNWIAYEPIADPTPCIFRLVNNSTDEKGIATSKWEIGKTGGGFREMVCSPGTGASHCTIQPTDLSGLGNYTIKLTVFDKEGLSDTATHDIEIKGEIKAGFMCSLDNLNWRACEDFSNKVTQKEKVYLKDDPSLAEYSQPSSGAKIVSRKWEINGTLFSSDNATNPFTFLSGQSNTIRLTVRDSAGRSDYQEHSISTTLPLPQYREIPPFLWLNKFFADLFNKFLPLGKAALGF